MSRWLSRLNAAAPAEGLGVSVIKSGLAQLAAPPQSYKPSVDKGAMSVTSVLTTDTPDRQGDVIDPTGGDFREHMTNPVVMFHHGKDHKLPIGKAEDRDGNYTVRLVKARDGSDVLLGTTHFAQSNRFANDVFGLVADDVLRGVSIGFDPLNHDGAVDELGPSPTLKRPALHFKGWKLLEYSHTPLGVNPDALTVAVQKAVDGSRPMHPLLLKYLTPLAPARRTVVPARLPSQRKAMPQQPPMDDSDLDDDDAQGADAGAVDGSVDAGFDPTADDPGMDPDLKGQGGYADNSEDDAPSPTVQALLDGGQGLLDLCGQVEQAMKQSEHMKGRKFAAKLCADLRSTAAECQSFAEKIRTELAGATAAPGAGFDADEDSDSDDGSDEDASPDKADQTEPKEPETDDEGALVAKGYTPRRWTYADLTGSAAPRTSSGSSAREKALEREVATLQKTLKGVLDDVEAARRRGR